MIIITSLYWAKSPMFYTFTSSHGQAFSLYGFTDQSSPNSAKYYTSHDIYIYI